MVTKDYKENNKGFVSTIVLVVFAILLLKYVVHFDVLEYLKLPGPQKVLSAVWHAIVVFYSWADGVVKSWFN